MSFDDEQTNQRLTSVKRPIFASENGWQISKSQDDVFHTKRTMNAEPSGWRGKRFRCIGVSPSKRKKSSHCVRFTKLSATDRIPRESREIATLREKQSVVRMLGAIDCSPSFDRFRIESNRLISDFVPFRASYKNRLVRFGLVSLIERNEHTQRIWSPR